jgi:hypothetical protein
MINFFRKIRKKLADDNKPLKYMRYAIGEILLVVIGILIALSINNWNENRKKDEVRRNYYVQMLQDLEQDKILMGEHIKRIDSILVKVQTYKEIFRKPDLPIWEITSIMEKVFESGYGWDFETNTNTITTLQSTGDIKLIPPILRNKILDLKRKQFGIKDFLNTNFEAILNSVTSTATLFGSSDLGKRAGNQPKLIKYYNDENIQIQSLMGLETIIDANVKLGLYAKKRFTKLNLDIEKITKLINEEMKK